MYLSNFILQTKLQKINEKKRHQILLQITELRFNLCNFVHYFTLKYK